MKSDKRITLEAKLAAYQDILAVVDKQSIAGPRAALKAVMVSVVTLRIQVLEKKLAKLG